MLGGDLAGIVPGSAQARRLKEVLIAPGLWSQYLEVGIGPDAEVFTKAPVLSAVGTGAEIGIHPGSVWNNPEPEVVLAVNSRGEIVGATLGNDVNLRDFEGRSALLLGKAKDNNASCAIGPFIRLFDASFGIDDVRRCTVSLEVTGPDGFVLQGAELDVADQPRPAGPGRADDRRAPPVPGRLHAVPGHHVRAHRRTAARPGSGFTHKLGDVVRISSSPKLGALVNRVNRSDRVAPWDFGVLALMRNLQRRGLLYRNV